ncbi:MAG: hypothetical protein KC535_05915, partial [Nanoarchaeota archaeon]|nr:hypothetical protein [Nanoarchaeota archaeon]
EIPSKLIRSDAEEPYEQIYETCEGQYFSGAELSENMEAELPQQRSDVGNKVNVFFQYNTDYEFKSKIVRDDALEPYNTFFQLNDGRIVKSVECQYSNIYDDEQESIKRANPSIEMLEKKIKKLNKNKQANYLHGIYKQFVSGKNGRLNKGVYRDNLEINPDSAIMGTIEMIGTAIIKKVERSEFINYLAEKLSEHDHLQNHATKLKNFENGYNSRIISGHFAPLSDFN